MTHRFDQLRPKSHASPCKTARSRMKMAVCSRINRSCDWCNSISSQDKSIECNSYWNIGKITQVSEKTKQKLLQQSPCDLKKNGRLNQTVFFTAIDEVIGVSFWSNVSISFSHSSWRRPTSSTPSLPSMKRDETPLYQTSIPKSSKSQYYVNYVQVLHSSPTWTKRKSIKCLSLSQLSWKTILLKLDHLQGSGWRIIE